MISSLHYITQKGPNGESHSAMAKSACEAGIRWVQLRVKNATDDQIKSEAIETLNVCRAHNAIAILNDRVELAAELGFDGVHIGKNDMPVKKARQLLGDNAIIGATANTLEDVLQHIEDGADYIGLGPFRFTSSKDKLSPILGVEGYQSICSNVPVQIPIIAIGGITESDVSDILTTGVHGVAVASIINRSDNKKQVVESFLKQLS